MMSPFIILTLNDLALRSKVKVNFAPNRELPSFCKQVLEGVTPFLCHKSPTNSALYNVFEVATFSQLIIN